MLSEWKQFQSRKGFTMILSHSNVMEKLFLSTAHRNGSQNQSRLWSFSFDVLMFKKGFGFSAKAFLQFSLEHSTKYIKPIWAKGSVWFHWVFQWSALSKAFARFGAEIIDLLRSSIPMEDRWSSVRFNGRKATKKMTKPIETGLAWSHRISQIFTFGEEFLWRRTIYFEHRLKKKTLKLSN